MLYEYLKKFDAVVDPARQKSSEELFRRAACYEPVEHLPLTVNCLAPDQPVFPYRETFEDKEKMLLTQLAAV